MEVLNTVERVFKQLKKEKTQEEIQEILEVGDEFKDKVVEMFNIGKDAADDAVEMFMLVASVLEQVLVQPVDARAISKPVHYCNNIDDLVQHVLIDMAERNGH